MSRRAAKPGPIVPVSANALIERASPVYIPTDHPHALRDARQQSPIAPGAAQKAAKRNKYGAVRTNGYASKREAARAAELKLLERAGKIKMLREQIKFILIPKQEGERECSYIVDFAYAEPASGTWFAVFEDCKGMKTAVYRIKRKLMLHVHGIRIRET